MKNPTVVWSDINRNASVRMIEQHLTREEVYEIARRPCTYCYHPGRSAAGFNGVDRIDCTGHYTMDNVQASCKICNKMKGEMSDQEFRNHIHRVYYGIQNKKWGGT